MSTTVRQILRGRSVVHTVAPADTVFHALGLMADRNIGAVLVWSEGRIDGIFSEREIGRAHV